MNPLLKTTAALLFAAAMATTSAFAAGDQWLTNYNEAKKLAAEENRLVLMDFTGKGWCGWCTKLTNEVFNTPEFQKFAKDNLVLLELDFQPAGSLPADIEAQNNKLASEYGVRGFPTIIVLSPDGKQVGKLGYQPGGPGPFIDALKGMQTSVEAG